MPFSSLIAWIVASTEDDFSAFNSIFIALRGDLLMPVLCSRISDLVPFSTCECSFTSIILTPSLYIPAGLSKKE